MLVFGVGVGVGVSVGIGVMCWCWCGVQELFGSFRVSKSSFVNDLAMST